jgi:hypothetical protein
MDRDSWFMDSRDPIGVLCNVEAGAGTSIRHRNKFLPLGKGDEVFLDPLGSSAILSTLPDACATKTNQTAWVMGLNSIAQGQERLPLTDYAPPSRHGRLVKPFSRLIFGFG